MDKCEKTKGKREEIMMKVSKGESTYKQQNKRNNAKTMAIPARTHLPQKYHPLLRRQPIPSKK